MRQFDYSHLADRTWDNETISYLTKIHEYKGKQELFLRQKQLCKDARFFFVRGIIEICIFALDAEFF